MNPEEVVLLLADEYSRMAETYDRNVTPQFAPIAERVLGAADPKPGELFLDLGTGTGLLACKVAPQVAPQNVVAIDLADGAIAAATYRAAGLGIQTVRFEMLDVAEVDHPAVFDPPESYLDFRLSWGVFEAEVSGMSPDARASFMETMKRELRSLARGGRLETRWVLHLYAARLR